MEKKFSAVSAPQKAHQFYLVPRFSDTDVAEKIFFVHMDHREPFINDLRQLFQFWLPHSLLLCPLLLPPSPFLKKIFLTVLNPLPLSACYHLWTFSQIFYRFLPHSITLSIFIPIFVIWYSLVGSGPRAAAPLKKLFPLRLNVIAC